MADEPTPKFIVGEVSKNWVRTGTVRALEWVPLKDGPVIAQWFEQMIAANDARGYALHSWHINRVMIGPDLMNETLVAVFQQK